MGGRPLDERELAADAKRGDVAAYEQLVAANQEVAFRVAYLITRSAAEAEDATQDGFVKAFYALPRFRSGRPFRPWVLRIVANEARNRVRSMSRRERLFERSLAARGGGLGDAASSPETLALAAESASFLAEAVERLDRRDREVIALRFFLDLTEAETAAALGCARGTVKSRLARALRRLRSSLDDEERSHELG